MMIWEPGCYLYPFFEVEQPSEQTALLPCNYKGLPNNTLVAIRDKMKMVESSHTSASSTPLTQSQYSEMVWKLLCNPEIGLSKLDSAWSNSAPWLSEDLGSEENLRILFSGPLEIEFPTDFLTPVPAAPTMTKHLASVLATFATSETVNSVWSQQWALVFKSSATFRSWVLSLKIGSPLLFIWCVKREENRREVQSVLVKEKQKSI